MVAVQPFFVFATYRYYKTPIMKDGIAHIYHYQRDCFDLACVSAIPDGCVDIYFEKSGSQIRVRVCGTVLQSTPLESRSDNEYFGIRFMPGVLPANLKVAMQDLIGQELNFSDVVKNTELAKRIQEALDWKDCIRLYLDDYFATLHSAECFIPARDPKQLVDYMRDLIIASSGDLQIQEIAQKTGYSTRYINALFNRYFGLSPKSFEAIVRFQYAVQMINHDQEKRLTTVGLESGYFDQAHFIREFKKYSAVTPAEYKKLVDDHYYLKRLTIVPT